MVNDRFIKLLTKELSDGLSPAEQDELKLLLQNNKEYADQREILKDYWKRDNAEYAANAAMFKRVTDRIKAEENSTTPESTDDIAAQIPHRKLLPAVWYSAAAVILIALSFFVYRYKLNPEFNNSSLAVKWLQQTTRPTIKSTITLSDGTVVTLNSATTLKYPDGFIGKTREVYLDGEAYFDVHKDHQHPFIIHTNKMNVRVLGTSFNVKSYKNEPLSETTLIRGSVEVTLNDRPSDRIILKPKEKLIVQNNISVKKQTNIADDSSSQESSGKGTRYSLTNLTYFPNNDKTIVETSWVQNKLMFSDKDFTQLSAQLERWYGVHIEFENNHVKEYRFTGLFQKESLPQALDALKMIEHFNYRITDSTVYIY
jgi:transmembrane sensor